MPKVKLASRDRHNDAVTNGVVSTDDVVASGHKEVQTHHHHVDGDDGGGHGGGPEHCLGAKRLQDAEASLAGYDGGQDLETQVNP